MVKKIEDWVTPFERLLMIKAPELTLQQCGQINKKDYRVWRKRMAASLKHPSPQTMRFAVA
jgi:hypothetical protein